jgi:hypothetical protein
MVRVTVLYPNESGKRFDHAYYAGKHLPMVMERLKGSGMLRYEVDKGLAGGGPGDPAPFVAACHLYLTPPPISRRGSTPTARRSWATFPITQTSHLRFRLVRSSWAETDHPARPRVGLGFHATNESQDFRHLGVGQVRKLGLGDLKLLGHQRCHDL